MFNVLLDPLPTEYEGYPIDSDFQTGIQIMQALEDKELNEQERVIISITLLFPQEDDNGNELPFPEIQTAVDGLFWFLTEWNKDNNVEPGNHTKATDFDIDQWRIYSAFREMYGINLNTDKLHYWEFMALLTTLNECAYTRVLDIRMKDLSGMKGKEKADYIKLKKRFSLDRQEQKEYTEEQKKLIDDYDAMREKQKEARARKKAVAEAFMASIK